MVIKDYDTLQSSLNKTYNMHILHTGITWYLYLKEKILIMSKLIDAGVMTFIKLSLLYAQSKVCKDNL